MTDSLPAPRPALVPTALPLPPQELSPAEVQAQLEAAKRAHAEAQAALTAAQDHFDAAERQREYALTQEQKREALELEAHINDLRRVLPYSEDDAERFRNRFREAVAEDPIDMARVLEAFTYWARNREVASRMRKQILLHDSQQDRDDYELWFRRTAGWAELIRTVTSWRKGGVLPGEDDDMAGLAAVNERINEESKDAPRPLNRDAADQSTPFVEDLGLRDPNLAGIDQVFSMVPQALDFGAEFSAAVDEAAKDWARDALTTLRANRTKRSAS